MDKIKRSGKPIYFKPEAKVNLKDKDLEDRRIEEERIHSQILPLLGRPRSSKDTSNEKENSPVKTSAFVTTKKETLNALENSSAPNKTTEEEAPAEKKFERNSSNVAAPTIAFKNFNPRPKVQKSFPVAEPASMEIRLPKVFRNFQQPENALSIRVAILGPANAGKSTLLNRFVESQVSIVSARPQTTRKRTKGIMTVKDTQVVFLDSPGVTIGSPMELKGIASPKESSKKLRFNRELTNSPWHCLEEADHMVVFLDAHKCLEHTLTTEDYIFSRLAKSNISIPATLVVNKMDSINPRDNMLKVIIDKYLNFYKHFDPAPVYISAATGDGVEDLRQRLLASAKPCPWSFPGHIKTDMSDFERVVETIRESYYSRLNSYLPYIFQQENTGWMENFDGSLFVYQSLLVKRDQHEKILVGSKGKMINEVTREVNRILSTQLCRKVRVFLQVKVVEKFPPT